MSSDRDIVELKFDRQTGAIDSLYTFSRHAEPGWRWAESLTAHDIPLSSYENNDGKLEAVWRLTGTMTCAVVDTATSWNSSHFSSRSLLLWSCTGDETPLLEIRMTN